MSAGTIRSLTIGLVVVAAVGCGRSSGSAPAAPPSATAIGPAECAACGMVVRDQPSPRGQLVHRDGTRHFFCSIGDMVQYLQSPSPHGAATAIWVEQQPPDADPSKRAVAPLTWVSAAKAGYLLGAKREGIMGPPVLSYGSAALAESARARLAGAHPGLRAVPWPGLAKAVLSASASR